MPYRTSEKGAVQKLVASKRRSRSAPWFDHSDSVTILDCRKDWEAEQQGKVVYIGPGYDCVRDLAVRFRDDLNETLRVKYNTRIRVGNPKWDKCAVTYPDPRVVFLPAGTSLEDVCRKYPRHVYKEGLRLFLVEDWDETRMWNAFPAAWQTISQAKRKENSLQAGLRRQVVKIWEEAYGEKWDPSKYTDSMLSDSSTANHTDQFGAVIEVSEQSEVLHMGIEDLGGVQEQTEKPSPAAAQYIEADETARVSSPFTDFEEISQLKPVMDSLWSDGGFLSYPDPGISDMQHYSPSTQRPVDVLEALEWQQLYDDQI